MNRDLLFFVSGLVFGVVAGYFVFRAVVPEGSGPERSAVADSPPPTERSSIGLEEEAEYSPLDEGEVARLEAALESRPEDAALHEELGRLYMAAGRFQEAADSLSRSAEIDPSRVGARNQLALAYLSLQDLDQAVATYEATLRVAPEDPGALLGLGRVKLYVQQDIRAGLALWERLLRVAPDSKEAQGIQDELEALKSAHSGG